MKLRNRSRNRADAETARLAEELQAIGAVDERSRIMVEQVGRKHARRFERWRRNVIIGYVVLLLGAGWTYHIVVQDQERQDALTTKIALIQSREHSKQERQDALTKKIALIQSREHSKHRSELVNRARNVGVWCGAINENRREGKRLRGREFHLKLLDCGALERRTLQSGNAQGAP